MSDFKTEDDLDNVPLIDALYFLANRLAHREISFLYVAAFVERSEAGPLTSGVIRRDPEAGGRDVFTVIADRGNAERQEEFLRRAMVSLGWREHPIDVFGRKVVALVPPNTGVRPAGETR